MIMDHIDNIDFLDTWKAMEVGTTNKLSHLIFMLFIFIQLLLESIE
jgi:hypothetical protein